MINLLWNSPWPIGGSTSFTTNLAALLGPQRARVVRLARRTESRARTLGATGIMYRNMALHDLVALPGPMLLCAGSPKTPTDDLEALAARPAGWWRVFHDPNEFNLYRHWQPNMGEEKNVICVREAGLVHRPDATFIPHPYVVRTDVRHDRERSRHARSTARICRSLTSISCTPNSTTRQRSPRTSHRGPTRWSLPASRGISSAIWMHRFAALPCLMYRFPIM